MPSATMVASISEANEMSADASARRARSEWTSRVSEMSSLMTSGASNRMCRRLANPAPASSMASLAPPPPVPADGAFDPPHRPASFPVLELFPRQAAAQPGDDRGRQLARQRPVPAHGAMDGLDDLPRRPSLDPIPGDPRPDPLEHGAP